MLNLYIINQKKFPISKKLLFNIARAARQKEKKLNGRVEAIIIGDNEMKKLNRRWRGIDKTTDVLSFAWTEDGQTKSDALGQIFISYPRVARQAKENKISLTEELSVIFAHGLLHLVGYDHAREKEMKKMFALQNNIARTARAICR